MYVRTKQSDDEQPGISRQSSSQASDSLPSGAEECDDDLSQPGTSNGKRRNQQPPPYNNRQLIMSQQLQQEEGNNQLTESEKVFKNGQLFNAIRKSKPQEGKLLKVQKHLDGGADINARDANEKHNTPLHVAVLKGELQIVKLLLNNGSDVDNLNSDCETPLDIAERLNKQDIVQELDIYIKYIQQASVRKESPFHQARQQRIGNKVINDVSKIKSLNQPKLTLDSQHTTQEVPYYNKGQGTAGINGQLYETKVTMLILLRALNDEEIGSFFLGTNIAGIGAFDDIVFCLNGQGDRKPRVTFIQAKHRDNPNTNPVTVGGLFKKDGDLSLHKYLDSYLRIKKKFNTENTDPVFKLDFKDIDCDFVFYTNANEILFDKKLDVKAESFIQTRNEGKTFKLIYENNNINELVKTASELHFKLLAESLAKFISPDESNYENMMSDELIKNYHVILAKKVIKLSDEIKETKNGKDVFFRYGNFYPDFFDNTEGLIFIFREALYKEIVMVHSRKISHSEFTETEIQKINNLVNTTNPSADIISELIGNVLAFDAKNKRLKFIQKEIPESLAQSRDNLKEKEVRQEIIEDAIRIAGRKKLKSFKVKFPDTFGNIDLKLSRNENKKVKRLNHLSNRFIKWFKDKKMTTIKETTTDEKIRANYIVRIDDTMVGPGNSNNGDIAINDGDIAINGGIGSLVGNLLILDEGARMLKFSNDCESLPENAKRLFEKLKQNFSEDNDLKGRDLNNYRFRINVNGFPRLSLVNRESDENLVKEFLDKLKFYTNQAKQSEVGEILKEEIGKHYNVKSDKQGVSYFDIKNDAIFLTVHEKVQQWWMETEEVYYLTNNCPFFNKAREDIIDSPLLNILDFIYINKIKQKDIEYNQDAIQSLDLDQFLLERNGRILNIVTKENMLSGIKLVQYFEDKYPKNYTFMDLDYVLRTCTYKAAITEFQETALDKLIIECKGYYTDDNVDKLYKALKDIVDNMSKSSKTIILITNEKEILAQKFKTDFSDNYLEIRDEKNNFKDLSLISQAKLLGQGMVIFQGIEINLGTLIIDEKSKNLVNAKILSKLINNKKIEIGKKLIDLGDVKYYYIDRVFNRKVTIKEKAVETTVEESEFLVIRNRDEIGSNIKQGQDILFISNSVEDFKEICQKYNGSNIHFLKKERGRFIWQQTQGNLNTLRKYIDNDKMDSYELDKITDVPDKVVIVAAKPGMGKSTVVTHLAARTKTNNSYLWIVRIDLVDCSSELHRLQHINFDEDKAFEFLLKVTNLKDSLEIKLFEDRFYTKGNIALLFDGFDEISPIYKNKVIELLQILKGTKVEKLWITTRPYGIQDELEDRLSTFSYELKPFLQEDQRSFLKKFWKKNLIRNDENDDCFEVFSDELIKGFTESISDHEDKFMGVPIHIMMIAEVFENDFKEFHNCRSKELSDEQKKSMTERLNLTNLYENFIKLKYLKFYCEGKKKQNSSNAAVIDDEKTLYFKFIRNHGKLAMHSLFKEDVLNKLFSQRERDEVYSLTQKINAGQNRVGIINKNVKGELHFVHKSFAEYFAGCYLWESFKSYPFNDFVVFINIIIKSLKEDSMLQTCKFFQLTTQKDLENNINFPDREYRVKILLKNLVDEVHRYGPNELNKHAIKLLFKIVEFSLSGHEGKDVEIIKQGFENTKNDKSFSLLCIAAEMGYIKFSNVLIRVASKQLNTQSLQNYLKGDKWCYSPLWLAAKNGHLDVIEFLHEQLFYDPFWKDKDGKILLQRITFPSYT